MMLYPPMSELAAKAGSRYLLVNLVARRARNAKLHPPRHADPAEYQRASALEALVGYLYIMGRAKRLDEIMRLALDGFF